MAFSQGLLRRLPFSESATPLQALTYLLGVSLFSISFLVFLNSSVSFVITDLIGVKDGVGDIVGTLGFVDEIVVLVACPIWGLVSDRSGVRYVAVTGYAVIGLALLLFVQARNVYPQLLLARLLFAVGASAAATMVTAVLPSLTDETGPAGRRTTRAPSPPSGRPSVTLSVDSEVTITPERFRNSTSYEHPLQDEWSQETGGKGKSSALAGFVGVFTGCGALVALSLFLPLPARFSKIEGVPLADAVRYSYYVVGVVSFLVAIFVFFGLRGLRGEEGKGWRMLFGLKGSTAQGEGSNSTKTKPLPYHHLLKSALQLGLTDPDIALGYFGGFVARASTVAISLFLPLYVNTFFFSHGFCQGSPTDPSPDLKRECRQAYALASILTGVAQLVGLLCAPLFGYLSGSSTRRKSRDGGTLVVKWPIVVSTTLGIAGYLAFPQLQSPEYRDVDGRGGGPVVFMLAALMGVSQIGAIVCSLGSLGRGVLKVEVVAVDAAARGLDADQETLIETAADEAGVAETAPLLESNRSAELVKDPVTRVQLKGSVAGVYSWCGGAAILLLTKLGGYLFDSWSRGAPFYLMAIFNGVLLLASIGIDVGQAVRARRRLGI
ncbi:hypothetical protein N657DRAFT_597752 [Parathielavia appendiculata]|uniref:MFS transporter n=1 Tax=Parathielavia appendiculata TaxID=2587402 RepID=A0AAN6TZA3_9PEZI|nr:hypothetical protein N657DRAFT_597752 [Parathielavia appendiculata]